MPREFEHQWDFTSSGGGSPIKVSGDVTQAAFFCQTGAASTATVSIQSALSTAGPWADEVAVGLSTGAATVIRISGPFYWIRAHNNSTGVVSIRGIGVS